MRLYNFLIRECKMSFIELDNTMVTDYEFLIAALNTSNTNDTDSTSVSPEYDKAFPIVNPDDMDPQRRKALRSMGYDV